MWVHKNTGGRTVLEEEEEEALEKPNHLSPDKLFLPFIRVLGARGKRAFARIFAHKFLVHGGERRRRKTRYLTWKEFCVLVLGFSLRSVVCYPTKKSIRIRGKVL